MWSHTDAAFSDEEEMVDMELYAPYVPQAMALLAWCACMALVAAGRIGGWRSVWMMLAGAGTMAVACLAANDRMAALSCVCVGLCVQAIPLLALVCLTGEARTCATMLADGTQVALTMTMVAETTYNGAYVCMGVVRLAATLAGLALLAIMLRSHLGRVLLGDGGMRTLAVAGVAVVLIALRSPNCSVVVDLPGWGFASLTEAAVACCMVALPSCRGLYAPPGAMAGFFLALACPRPCSPCPAACLTSATPRPEPPSP